MIYCDACAKSAFAIPIQPTVFKVLGTCQVCGVSKPCNGGDGLMYAAWETERCGPRKHFGEFNATWRWISC